MRAFRRFTVHVVLPEPLRCLSELARNLRWSWNEPTRQLIEAVDPEIWQSVDCDPMRLLGEVPPERWETLARDDDFVAWANRVRADLQDYLTGNLWYQRLSGAKPAAIGYFSPEFGITAALPQYSGGLGILAGDHLKAASDLGVPIVGVGLFYRSGYFAQSLSAEGWQMERYPLLDPHNLPVSLVREQDGRPATIVIDLPADRHVAAHIRLAEVGRVPLLLLDCDIEENTSADREVTDRLYGGGSEHRLLQEMMLGIGGVRAIRAYSRITGFAEPDVFHTNEGHAGFQGLERTRELMEQGGFSFDQAREAVRAGTVFTTHTPVPAGIDRFPVDLISQYFGDDRALPGVPLNRVLVLGEETYEGGDAAVFNMAVMGLRLAQRANGVSELHGRVSRGMFAGLWEGFDPEEVPISSITNGVHAPTWVSREVWELASRATGERLVEEAKGWESIADIPGEDIWSTKLKLRNRLVADARERLRESWTQRGASPAELGWVDDVLDPNILTIGFARRVPSYKRLTLMLRDPDRLKALLLDRERPVQFVIAGKAHPADDGGKRLIQELVRFADDPEVRHRIVFLPNYDMNMAAVLYPGCDVWLNNPLRPLEACGTSGMKAALNGALNLSVLDGWWDEWFDHENGWAIPTADGVEDPDRRDDIEASALYELIEDRVAACFYDVGADGLPARWIEMVRKTLQFTGPKVLASRMVRDYVQKLYRPAAESSAQNAADDFRFAREIAAWKERVRRDWTGVALEHVETAGIGDEPSIGDVLFVRVYAALGELGSEDVAVEAIHGRADASDALGDTRTTDLAPVESYEGNRWLFEGSIPLDRSGPFGYTVRIVPRHPGLVSDAEMGLVGLPPRPERMSEGDLR
ncbi:MAG: alpha-glucan family phosphorylase [Candidatus Nanopelagicales bacterium]|nr:alpha-glucan family phosphorylase [Candidatus Nanopelagicales bacterium]